MNVMQIVAKASNPLTLLMGVSSVVFGTSAAVIHGNEETLPAFLCLLFAVFAQIAGNITHRYADFLGNYGENEADGLREGLTPFPMKMIFTEGITAASIITVMIGLVILVMAGWWTVVIAALIAVVIMLANFGRKPWSRSSRYLILTFLTFGPVGVVGTSLVQSSNHADPALFNEWDVMPAVIMSVVAGLYAVNVHLTYLASDFHRNIEARHNTSVTRLGAKCIRNVLIINGVIAAAIAGGSPLLLYVEHWCYLAVPWISFMVTLWCAVRIGHGDGSRRIWVVMSLNMFVFSIATLVMFAVIGYSYGSTGMRPY